MSAHKTQTIKSTVKFVEFISKNCEKDETLFRGQPFDEPLLPRIARLTLKSGVRLTERRMIQELKRRSISLLDSQLRQSAQCAIRV